MENERVTGRFAPSPTGYLHLGNARLALINSLLARQRAGRYLLRIDDTDAERSKEHYVEALREDLDWLGIVPDSEIRQSERLESYDAATAQLKESGSLYPCYETPEELAVKRATARHRGAPPVYDRAGLRLTAADRRNHEKEGRRPHWRFRLSGEPQHWHDLIRGDQMMDTGSVSDPVLIRADGSYLYSLPSVVDDISCEVTHIFRGEDHVTNSGVQIEIFAALGATPPEMGHFPLLTGPGGEPLSKRHGALSLRGLREQGIEPEAVCSLLARLGTPLALSAQAYSSMVADFDPRGFARSAAVLDRAQLDAMNIEFVRSASYETARRRLGDHRYAASFSPEFWQSIAANVERFADCGQWLELICGDDDVLQEDIDDSERSFLHLAARCLPTGVADEDMWQVWIDRLRQTSDRRGKALFMPLRRALTGRRDGPDLRTTVALLGADRVRARLLCVG